MRTLALVFVLFVPLHAAAYMDIDPAREAVAAEGARPMNRCQIQGKHVAGVVSVDMRNGTRGDVVLRDVEATITMATTPTDIVYYVTAPLYFQGTYAPSGLGAPAAFVRRAYRANGVSLKANLPFEIRLDRGGEIAEARVPSPYGGALEIDVPCALLTAGAPRAAMTPPAERIRGGLVAIGPAAVLLSAPGREGVPIARIVSDAGAAVVFPGAIRPAENGFVRIRITSPLATLEGYVHGTLVEAMPEPAIAPVAYASGFAFPARTTSTGQRTVRFPHGTALFIDGTTRLPWATVTNGLRADYVPGSPRGTMVLGGLDLPVLACRHDGVLGRPPCGAPRDAPRLGVRACVGSACTERGYVTPL